MGEIEPNLWHSDGWLGRLASTSYDGLTLIKPPARTAPVTSRPVSALAPFHVVSESIEERYV